MCQALSIIKLQWTLEPVAAEQWCGNTICRATVVQHVMHMSRMDAIEGMSAVA